MKEHGFDPGPKRGEKTWSEFLEMHAHSFWQCDFVSKKVCTVLGVREFFLIAFLHVGTRRVFVTAATEHPKADWVAEQAQAFIRHLNETGLQAEYLYHDRDGKYGKAFDAPLEAHGIDLPVHNLQRAKLTAHCTAGRICWLGAAPK
jgi:putative transposase